MPLLGPRPLPLAARRLGIGAGAVRRRPGRLVVLGFAGAILLGAILLALPVSAAGRPATALEALFTATSAVCVTGLAVVDTATFWSPFGQVVILVLIQLGGFGIMTLASLVGLLVARRLDLRSRLVAATSTRSGGLGDVRTVLLGILKVTVVVELLVALLVSGRMLIGYGESAGQALWTGAFHAVSAFNNAGFGLYSDSLTRFGTDPWILLPLCAAVIVGGIGFPVVFEVTRGLRRRARWSLTTRLMILTTGVLLTLGTSFFLVSEWGNPRTLGPLGPAEKLLAAFTQSVMARTAGFNSVDTAGMNEGTWLGTDVLMFIGGGSGGTAGGIKVVTFAVLAFVIWSELRGDPDVTVLDHRLSPATQRQAVSIALLSIAIVIVPTIIITATSPFGLDRVLFEVVSAFSTTGLSTGITADLSSPHQLVLVALMFVGRLGPIAAGTTLALRERQRLYRRPEAAAMVG
ncbi:TrkH family potassium uptake protein [Oerskovia turbata]|uniref:TrkH family potassium uptake protein n=1 Tax=Oerskovia turbata TaxID=1713 RepID=A0A4Q1KSY3_9CELL|nr:potassium transporter TrkG [Oerskovia turbata]RXR25339.1 TrkH family potassium uptake protein [Oerskovia turbata]RXR32720.1 TrkH family potassium uptake protein [Oerskovia turbata]TGJ95603.1 ATPase [Actinotalea fermentans ATCC 43279 = JCM 9966 = DSM 3133]